MTLRALCFAVALAAFAALLMGAAVYFHRRQRRSSGQDWEQIVSRLLPLDRNHVALVALDLIGQTEDVPCPEERSLFDPSQTWELLGGTSGVEIMRSNCEVLIDLACYVQQQYPEALVVAEELRLNAREIQWHLERLHGAERTGKLEAVFPEYAQRAARTYYQMTQRLLTLYELAEMPLAQEKLQTVL